MELLDGETLRARLERGPLSWRKAVEIGSAIADGLGAAHAKGMVHRDLKPANVFLTADGRVKVLYFGLAKLCEPSGADPLSSPTLSQTDPGAALGTVGYMSPEQVAGTAVTARSDLFALGCVLQEMVSGKQTFARRTAAETMAAILNEDPPEIVADAPLELRRSIARCLEKDPDARFQSARDLAFHLRALLDPAASGRAPAPSAGGQTQRRRVIWLAVSAAAVTALVLLSLFWRTAPQVAPSAVQSYLLPPDGTVVIGAAGIPVRAGPFAVSPDGQQLVLVASERDGKPWLWLQRLNSLTARRLEGTEDAGGPFWSPDGRSIGFSAGNQLKSIAVSGGPPQILGETKTPSYSLAGGDWNPTGDLVFGQYYQALLRLPPSGGAPVPATELDRLRGDTYHCCPAFLPDGRHFLYFVSAASPERTGIYLGSLDSKASTFLLRSTGKAAFAAPGHLLFRRGEVLMAASFDGARLRVTGDPLPLTDRGSEFSVSSNGVLVYRPASTRQLVWADRKGNEIEQLPIRGVLRFRRLSHDGRRLAAAVPDRLTGTTDIWVHDLITHRGIKLTSHPADEIAPVWSPDDERIVFTSNRKGRFDIYETPSDGSGHEKLVYESDVSKGVGSWSEDGRYLIFNTDGQATGEMWRLSLPERRATPLFSTSFLLWDGQISPDGRVLAYMSDETDGRHEVYAQQFPSGKKSRVSTSGGRWPKWGPRGKELFFIDDDTRTLRAVAVNTSGSYTVGKPRSLFPVPISYGDAWFNTPDGERFLFAKAVPGERGYALTLVQNWPALLKH